MNVYRITKYDPADRNEYGHYTGAEEPISDHGPVEAAYLLAAAAFAEASGLTRLTIREPGLAPGYACFGLEPPVEGHGLTGLFPPDLEGFHDGAEVPLAVGLELVRAMLRDNGAFCSLEVEDRFFLHIGWDQYMYIGTSEICESAVALARSLGLFPEPLEASPYENPFDEPGEQRPADTDFWAGVRAAVAGGAAILEEGPVLNVSRWHRLTTENLNEVRARLTPRARVTVWPDLSTDVAAVLAALPAEDTLEFVWEDDAGRITSIIADEAVFPELTETLASARALAARSVAIDDHRPLFAAVLPDPDGVLRARWRTDPVRGA